jgi:hypothetical protein
MDVFARDSGYEGSFSFWMCWKRLHLGGECEACRSGNVADYVLYAGHGVNEMSDEKHNLPPVYLPLPRKSSFLVVFFSPGFRGWQGKKSQRWVFNLFNISMSYSGLTLGLCWSGIVYDPCQADGVPEGPLTCLSYQNPFYGWLPFPRSREVREEHGV